MIPTCPRCGSVDLHSSRSKGPVDKLARALGLPPRRCSACGLRIHRPRPLCPSRHGSAPELAAAQAGPEPAPPQAEPVAAPPQVELACKQTPGRKYRRRRPPVARNASVWKVLLLALALGGLLGYAVFGVAS